MRTKFEEGEQVGIEKGRELERQKFEEERELERKTVEEERELERKTVEEERELKRKTVEEENNKNTIGIIRMMLESGANDEFIKKVVNANGKYTDSDLDNMINYAKEEMEQPSAKKIRHG